LAAGGRQVRVAGLLVVHKSPPTAKGFHFLSPEDEDSLMDVIVRPPIYERFRTVIRVRSLLLVGGEMQREGAVSNLIAEWVAGL
jgi:DNA polymerase III alpha subunit